MEQRIIKFKAKSLGSGKWVEGDLVHLGKRVCIGGDHLKDGIVDVDPSTVCQYTGLKDSKGKEVWEHDMLANVTNDSPDGTVVFKYGAFSLIAKNGRDFCISLSYLSDNDTLNRFKVLHSKFDKEM